MAWITIANVRGPRGLKGNPGDPLNAAGWQYMKDNFDALDGRDERAPLNGGRDVLHSFPDSNNRETWLGTRKSDGGPTDTSMAHLTGRLGVHQFGEYPDDKPNTYGGFTDAAFRFTELRFESETGRVPDNVLQAWKQRMGASGGGGGVGPGLAPSDRMVVGGQLVPVFPDTGNLTAWGSSTIEVLAPFLVSTMADTGADVHNEGKSAERVEHTAARIGSYPALLTVTGGGIPASGSVTVTASNMETMAALKTYTGTLAGVPGTLSSTSTEMTFTRSAAGSAVTVPAGTPFIPTVGMGSRNHVTLLNIGKNSLRTTGSNTKVIQYTDTTFDWLSPLVKRCIVLGQFVDSDQVVGGIQEVEVTAVNNAQRARYGDLFVDLRAYLSSSQLWDDTGITPTSLDLSQQASGLKPTSVSVDSAHLNAAGNTAVANLIRTHLSILGWY